jgi:hypothetical protein
MFYAYDHIDRYLISDGIIETNDDGTPDPEFTCSREFFATHKFDGVTVTDAGIEFTASINVLYELHQQILASNPAYDDAGHEYLCSVIIAIKKRQPAIYRRNYPDHSDLYPAVFDIATLPVSSIIVKNADGTVDIFDAIDDPDPVAQYTL